MITGVAVVLGLLVGGVPAVASPGNAAIATSGMQTVIVTLSPQAGEPRAAAQRLAAQHRMTVGHVYQHAMLGFSATLPAAAVTALQRSPGVIDVEVETIEQLVTQTAPTGIQRIGADLLHGALPKTAGRTSVPLDVAIIDTGIQRGHPDLNVQDGRNFTPGGASAWDDADGHGTHVAGTVGAYDNGIGVVGVAPGARVWPVKVCRPEGCYASELIAGIDWVAGKKRDFSKGLEGGIDFAVANYSISSADSDNPCTSPANGTHRAICGLVDSGVVFAMAAGNDNREKTPYPVAFSVAAVSDGDGLPGGLTAPSCRTDGDDVLANFSNFGPKIDIAAPGVCILSTWLDDGYRAISGTSMAAPHVAGAIALYLHAKRLSPAADAAGVAAIEQAILGQALPAGRTTDPCSYDGRSVRVRNRTIAVSGGPLLFLNGKAFGGTGVCDRTAGDHSAGPGDGADDGGTGGDIDTGGDGVVLATVTAVDYSTSGGKNSDRHLNIAVRLGAGGTAVSGASVTIDLFRDGSLYATGTATTSSSGVASFTANSAPSGTYRTVVTAVNGVGWDEQTPTNSHTK
jgi:subtilisin